MPLSHQIIQTLTLSTALIFAQAHAQSREPVAPFKDGHYLNPHIEKSKKNVGGYLTMRWFGDDEWADYPATAHLVGRAAKDTATIQNPDPNVLQATWIGHSTTLIQYRGKNVLTDPIFSTRASPVSFAGPKRVTQPGYTLDELPPIDLIVISHNHYDHLDRQSLKQLADNTRHIAVPLGLGKWVGNKTPMGERVTEFDWWQRESIEGISVTATPSQHWSSRSPGDRFETLWAAWAITIDDRTIWFGGDTGYNPIQFKEIGNRFDRIDLGIIPIGAYAPRWFMKDMHVNPEEAVMIHQDIGAIQSFGVHWGTFPLTSEPIDEPPARLNRALEAASIAPEKFQSLDLGETIQIR